MTIHSAWGRHVDVAVHDHQVTTDGLEIARPFVEETEITAIRMGPGPGQDMVIVEPDEVRSDTTVVYDPHVASVGCARQHACSTPRPIHGPAMQKFEARAIGTDEQVVEPVFCPGDISVRGRDRDDVGERENQIVCPGFEVDAPDAGVVGREVVVVGVRDAGVAVAGPGVVVSGEVGREGGLAVRREGIDGGGDCPFRSRSRVEEVGDESVPLAIVPDDPGVRTGEPLQHASLLPAPGGTSTEFGPAIPILQIDHSDRDVVVGRGRSMLEVDFHAEHVTAAGVELELVVVGEPVVPRASGERFDGNLLVEPFHKSAIDISVS